MLIPSPQQVLDGVGPVLAVGIKLDHGVVAVTCRESPAKSLPDRQPRPSIAVQGQQPAPLMRCDPVPHPGRCLITRRVIHHQQLEFGGGQTGQIIQGSLDARLFVVGGHNDEQHHSAFCDQSLTTIPIDLTVTIPTTAPRARAGNFATPSK